jgi:hypothetical protein
MRSRHPIRHSPDLSTAEPLCELRTLLAPRPPDEMEAYAVSTAVNSPKNDSVECVRRVASQYPIGFAAFIWNAARSPGCADFS